MLSASFFLILALVCASPQAVYDPADAKPSGAVRHRGPVWAVTFSADGHSLVSAGADHTIRLWDTQVGKQLRCWTAHQDAIWSVTVSPDGRLLASASQDGTIGLWEMRSGRLVRRIRTPHGGIRGVAFAPDGRMLASGGEDNSVRIWDVQTGQQLRRLQGHSERVTCVSFSRDGKLLASGSWDTTVCLWNPATGTLIRRLQGGLHTLITLAFSPDSKSLVAGNFDAEPLVVWDVSTGTIRRTLESTPGILSCADLSPDGRTVVAAAAEQGGELLLHLWDADSGRERRRLFGIPDAVQCITYSRDGSRLAAGCLGGSIHVWDADSGAKLLPERAEYGASALVFRAGQSAAPAGFTADGRAIALADANGAISLRELATGREVRSFRGHKGKAYGIALTSDGSVVVSAGQDRTVRLWDVKTGRAIGSPLRHAAAVEEVTATSDGRFVATRSADSSVRLWQASTATELCRLTGWQHAFPSLALSSDGRILLFFGKDGIIHVWDRRSGADKIFLNASHTANLHEPHDISAQSVALAPDARSVALAFPSDATRIYELASHRERSSVFHGHYSVRCLAYSAEGRTIAGVDDKGTVHVCDLVSEKEYFQLPAHGGAMSGLSFSADWRMVATTTADRGLLVWRLPPPPALAEADSRPVTLAAGELEQNWSDLASPDMRRVRAALWRLVATPAQSVPFLAERLRHPSAPQVVRIPDLIRELDSNSFTVRKRATEELEEMGDLAQAALTQTLREKTSLEVRQRVEQLLERLETGSLSPRWLRELRAVEILDQIANAPARDALAAVVRTQPGSPIGIDAKSSLDRLARRSR
jgi:WD40 repeat protein